MFAFQSTSPRYALPNTGGCDYRVREPVPHQKFPPVHRPAPVRVEHAPHRVDDRPNVPQRRHVLTQPEGFYQRANNLLLFELAAVVLVPVLEPFVGRPRYGRRRRPFALRASGEVFRDVLDEPASADELVLLHVAVAVYVPLAPHLRELPLDGVPVAAYLRPQGFENLRGREPPVAVHVHRGEPAVGILSWRRNREHAVERRATDRALAVMHAEFVGAREVEEVSARPRSFLPHPPSVLLGQHGGALRTQRVEAHRALAVRLGDVRVPRRPRRRRSRTGLSQMLTLGHPGRARGGHERGAVRPSHHRRHGPGVGARAEPDVEAEPHALR
mmetsp:Transcript_4585/g.20854  ORF Transcript_4585/g.20854 Transcript_4585/m.20854 type:complete len:329 (-) Transcript_4585:80-1066(-)